MAHHISQTLTHFKSPTILRKLLPISLSSSSSSISHHPTKRINHFSTKGHLIEVDLDSSSSSSSSSSDGGNNNEVLGLKKLEDAIHSLIVRRLAPDWLPFRPGSSYWVPPKRNADNIVELVEKLTNPLTDEECLSLTSDRGFPSSSFFLKDSAHAIPVEVEVQVHVLGNPAKPSLTEDED